MGSFLGFSGDSSHSGEAEVERTVTGDVSLDFAGASVDFALSIGGGKMSLGCMSTVYRD